MLLSLSGMIQITSEHYRVFDQQITSLGQPYLLFWRTGFSLEPWKWCSRAGPVQIPDMPFWDKAIFRWSCMWFSFIKRTHFVKRETVLANSIRNYLINFIARQLVTDVGHTVTSIYVMLQLIFHVPGTLWCCCVTILGAHNLSKGRIAASLS